MPRPPLVEGGFEYSDFKIGIRRRDAKCVDVRGTTADGTTARAGRLSFPEAEASRIHNTFRYRFGQEQPGSGLITQVEATVLGKQLAEILLPRAVFELLRRSLAEAVSRPRGALRLRLEMDGELAELPWEYVYRPDHREGVSGFLLLDPRISLLRHVKRNQPALEPITGKQRLTFVGTLWQDGQDHWQVRTEFDLLRTALRPVSEYVWPDYGLGSEDEAFGGRLELGSAIFHYAGHCDFDSKGEGYLLREMPLSQSLREAPKAYLEDIARALKAGRARLAVLSACNSGFWAAVRPLLEAGVPAVLGVNGSVASDSTIEFCAKVYESLSLGLSLDEAVGRARLHLVEWDAAHGRFDWGLFMVYTCSAQTVLFPRKTSPALATRQSQVRQEHRATGQKVVDWARVLDGVNFGELLSELPRRRVLILGRFTEARLAVLKAIREGLQKHPNRYIGELFVYDKPELRDLAESIKAFAVMARFIIADISDASGVQAELEAIVPNFMSVPVVPVIKQGGEVYSLFESVSRKPNVVKPTLRYRDVDDLMSKLDAQVIAKAEAKLRKVRPRAAN